MAYSRNAPSLMDLPLEVRHNIFKHVVASSSVKPKKLLRYWFEKKEIGETVAQHIAAEPNGPAPRVLPSDDFDGYDDSETADSNDEDETVGDGSDEEQAGEDDEDVDEDEDEAEDEDEDVEDEEDEVVEEDEENQQQEEMEQDAADALNVPNDGADIDEMEGDHATSGPTTNQHSSSAIGVSGDVLSTQVPAIASNQGTGHQVGIDSDVSIVDPDQGAQDDEGDDMDVDASMGDGPDAGHQNATQAPPQPAPVVRAHHKWRHIPNFMRITSLPPPLELLLTSKQLNEEAKDWFYNVAILRIEATASFAHTSFFEEAFNQITQAAFSPMENIRKVEVTFVWDTTWIRADDSGTVGAIFPALLDQRASFVYSILAQAPDLKSVVVNWHDSAQDNESANLMLDTLVRFHTLHANVKINEHYIAADDTPHKRSIAGKRRVEFQNILDRGLDTMN
ncbi:hypothetical protein ACN47E_006917 [Coniothyrium glycines]